MNYMRFKILLVLSLTLALMGVVIRAIWQIVDIPTPNTMIIFIPLIIALLGGNAFLAYIIFHPQKIRSLPVVVGLTLVLTAGLVAGVKHYINYIPSPEAQWLLSKIIATLIVLGSVGIYLLVLWILWSFWKKGRIT